MKVSKEEFDELLAVSKKAGLVPKKDWRFEWFERFLESVIDLDFFSQEEKDKLTTKFKNLSPEDKQLVIDKAAYKMSPDIFNLTYEEAKKLEKERKELSLHERARLSEKFSTVFGGWAWLDLGEVLQAKIQIDDNSSPDREIKPYAYVYFNDDFNRRVETIDIIASVEQDARAIGHPAIVAAINYWQNVIYSKHVHNRLDKADNHPDVKDNRILYARRFIEIAQKNLEALSKALLTGADNQSLNPKEAIVVTLRSMDLDNPENTLYLAWKLCKEFDFTHDDDLTQFEEKLKNEILQYNDAQNSNLYFNTIMDFLRDEGEKGGFQRFVAPTKKPTWEIFRNAFAAWYFDIKVSTLKSYISEYKDLEPKEDITKGISTYSITYPKTFIAYVILSILSKPLVFARDPVWISENNLGLSIEEMINE